MIDEELKNKRVVDYGAKCISGFCVDDTCNRMDGYRDGYVDGYNDATKAERCPSDDMLRKIVNECWMKMATNSIDGTDAMIEYIKKNLYKKI